MVKAKARRQLVLSRLGDSQIPVSRPADNSVTWIDMAFAFLVHKIKKTFARMLVVVSYINEVQQKQYLCQWCTMVQTSTGIKNFLPLCWSEAQFQNVIKTVGPMCACWDNFPFFLCSSLNLAFCFVDVDIAETGRRHVVGDWSCFLGLVPNNK